MKATSNSKVQQIGQIKIFSLRGGGICSSNQISPLVQRTTSINELPFGFDQNIQKHSQIIIEKVPIQSAGSDTLISFQWFLLNEGNFWKIANDKFLVIKFYDICLTRLEDFIKILSKYLGCSGFLFYQLLKICNIVMQIIVRYQYFNEIRYIDEERKNEMKIELGEIENLISIESNRIWETGVLYELQLLNVALTHLRTNSTQGQEIFAQFIVGLATSLASFKLSDDLMEALKEGTKFIFIKFYEEQIQNPIELYKIFQFFNEIKWKILFSIGKHQIVYQLIDQLKEGYNQNLQNSKNWIAHYCWIETISDLLTYKPIINRQNVSKEQWDQLLNQKQITTNSYNKQEAFVCLPLNKQFSIPNTSFQINNIDFMQFSNFKMLLLEYNMSEQQSIKLWNQYLKFEFSNYKKQGKYSQNDELISLLKPDINFMNQLSHQLKSTKKNFNEISNQKIQLIWLYEKESSDTSKQIIISDINLLFINQDKVTQIVLITINEYFLYFTFYVGQTQIFLNQLISQNILKENPTIAKFSKSIEDLILQYKEFKEKRLNNFVKSWLSLLMIISKEEVSFTIFNNWQVHENSIHFGQVIQTVFDEPLLIIEKINKSITSIFNNLEIILSELNGKKFQLQLIEILEMNNVLLKVEKASIIPNLLTQFSNNHPNQSKVIENIIISSNWKFENAQELKTTMSECSCLLKSIKSLRCLLSISGYKHQQLKEYLENIVIDAESFSQASNNFTQQNHEIVSILRKQKFFFQSVSNVPSSEEKKQVFQQISIFEQQLIQIKNYMNLQSLQKLIANSAKNILCKINIFPLLQDDWSENKQNLLKQYDSLLCEINAEENKIQTKDLKGAKIVNMQMEIERIIKQLDNQTLKKQKKKLKQQLNSWSQVFKVLSHLVDGGENSEQIKNQDNLEIINLIANIQNQFDQILQSISKSVVLLETNSLIENSIKLNANYLVDFYYFINLKNREIPSSKYKTTNLYYEFLSQLIFNQSDQTIQSQNVFSKILENKSYKIRECLLFNLIKIQVQHSDPVILKFSQELIKQFWMQEKEQKVRELLRNSEMIEMQKRIFNYDLKSFADQLQNQMKEKMIEIEKIESDARLEGVSQKGQEFEQLLNKKYAEFEQIFENVGEMQDLLGLNLFFLKEISKEIKVIKNKIDKLQDTIDIIGNDVRRLRGKSYQELLQLRMDKVMHSMNLRDLDSVYIEIKTQELDPITGQNVLTANGSTISSLFKPNFNDFEGEINEFLWSPKEIEKDILLIKGQAGSGKSRAARMIEEFIWKHWQQPQTEKKKWIPIFISLPQLKDPKFSLFNEALQLENYQFDSFQIKELFEAIQKDEINLLLILDSYDEMTSSNTQSNLYQTNKLQQEFFIEVPGKKIKIIITVRTEILQQQNYQNLFYGNSIKNIKEVELLPFNQDQASEYLKQYCKLNVRRYVKNLYDFIRQTKGQKFDIEQFLCIVKPIDVIFKIKDGDQTQKLSVEQEPQDILISELSKNNIKNIDSNFSIVQQFSELKRVDFHKFFNHKTIQSGKKQQGKQGSSAMLNDQEIESIIKGLRKSTFFEKIEDQLFLALQKDLANIWSEDKFSITIKSIQIEHLLQTPFMMEIVVQVLPQIVIIFSDREIINNYFSKNFKHQAQCFEVSKILVSSYQQTDKHAKIDFKKIETNVERKLERILNLLEDQKFFKQYQISDQLEQKDNTLIVKNLEINFDDDQTIEIVIKSLKQQNITIFDFYQTFAQFYSEVQLQKWKALGSINNYDSLLIDFHEFQESLALDMSIRQLAQVIYKPKGQLKFKKAQSSQIEQDSWEEQYFGNSIDPNYQKILRSCILLTTNGSTYSFNHKSIQEFFVGKFILDVLNLVPEETQSCENLKIQEELLKSLFNTNLFNISKMEYQGALRITKEKLKLINNLKSKLLCVINLSKNKINYQRASSNCMYLLKELNLYLIDEQLNNIHISDISIKGLQFHNCDLSNSRFDNAIIDSCNFNLCNLHNVNWSNTICHQPINIQAHEKEVNQIAYLQSELLATISLDGIIYIWNAKDGKKIRNIDSQLERVNQMICSCNGNLLAVCNDSTIKIWNIKSIIESDATLIGIIYYPSKQLFFTSNDNILVSTTLKYGPIISWDINELRKNYIPEQSKKMAEINQLVTASALFLEGEYLIFGFDDGSLNVYKINENYKLHFQSKKHQKKITIITASKQEKMFASVSQDQTIIVWKYITSNEIIDQHIIPYYFLFLTKIIFAPFKNFLYYLGIDNYIYKLNLNENKQLTQHQEQIQKILPIKCYEFKANYLGNIVAITENENHRINIYDINNLDQCIQIGEIKIEEDRLYYTFFSNKKYLVLGFNNQFQLWDYIKIKKIHEFKVVEFLFREIAFSTDDNQILIKQQNEGQIQLWNIEQYPILENTFEIKDIKQVVSFLFSPSNKYILAQKNNCIQIFDSTTIQSLQVISTKQKISFIKFWDNDLLFFVCAEKGNYAFVFENETFSEFEEHLLYKNYEECQKFFINAEKNILIMMFYRMTLIWSIQHNLNLCNSDSSKIKNQRFQFNLLHIQQCFINPENQIFLAKHQAIISINPFNRQEYEQILTFLDKEFNSNFDVINKHQHIVRDLSFSQDNELFVSASLEECIIWNNNTMEIIQILSFGGGSVYFMENSKIIFHNLKQGIIIFDWQKNNNDFFVANSLTEDESFQGYSKTNSCKLIFQDMKILYTFTQSDYICYYIWSDQGESTFVQKSYFQIYSYNQICIDLKYQRVLFYDKNSNSVYQSSFYNGFYKKRYFINSEFQLTGFSITKNNQMILGEQNQIKVSSEDGEILHLYKCQQYIKDIQFLNETYQLIIISTGFITVFNYKDIIQSTNKLYLQPSIFHTFKIDQEHEGIKVIEKLSILISFSGLLIYTWDIKQKQTLLPFQADISEIKSITISSDSETFATGSQNGNVKIQYLQSQLQIISNESHQHSIDKLYYTYEPQQVRFCNFHLGYKSKIVAKNFAKCFQTNYYQQTLQIFTNQSEIFISNQSIHSQYQYLEFFEEIQLNLVDANMCQYFYFPKNGKGLVTVSLYGCKIYENQNFYNQNPEFGFIWIGTKQEKVFFEIKEFNCFLMYDRKAFKISYHVNYSYKNEIRNFRQFKLIVFYGNYLIMTEQESKKIILYQNVSEFFEGSKEIELVAHDSPIICILVYSVYMISADNNGIIIFWSLENFQTLYILDLKQHLQNYENCYSLEISQNEKFLATGHENGILIIWNIENIKNITQKYQFLVPQTQKVEKIVFLPTDNAVACLCNQFIWYFNLNEKQKHQIFRSTFRCQRQFAFDPINHKLLCFHQNYLKAFYIYDSFNCQQLQITEEIGVRKFCNNDENILIYSNQEKFLKIYDVENQKQIGQTEYSIQPKKLLVSQSHRVIVSLNVENKLECWMVTTFQSICQHNLPTEINQNITCMEITENDQILVFGNTTLELIIMELQTMQIYLKFKITLN